MIINGLSRWPLDSNLFSACSILYIYNSKYQFPFQTADDCLGKEKVLVHLKFHRERKPLKLLSCVNGRGICNLGPPRDSNNVSVVLRSPAFAKHGKSDVAIPDSRRKPAYGYDIGVQKTLLLWFSGDFPWWPPSNAEGNSHPAAMESCGYPSEKRSPRIGQQDVSSCLPVSFSKNATLISNCSRSRESPGKSVLCRLVCLTQDV